MYSKKKTQELIDNYAEPFRKALGIKNIVKIHVYNSTTKKYKAITSSKCDLQGITYLSSEGYAEVIIFNNRHTNERETLGTLFHELLHVRMFKLTGMITMKAERANVVEEDLVRDLEALFLMVFFDGNKLHV